MNIEHGLCCVECHAQGMAQGENAGTEVERERIVELLERQFSSSYWSDLSPEYLLALVKGENK